MGFCVQPSCFPPFFVMCGFASRNLRTEFRDSISLVEASIVKAFILHRLFMILLSSSQSSNEGVELILPLTPPFF